MYFQVAIVYPIAVLHFLHEMGKVGSHLTSRTVRTGGEA